MSTVLSQNEVHLTVGRWSGTYHVPRDYAAPQDLQGRIDRIVADRLSSACKSLLEHFLSAADPAIWRIRDLELNFAVDADSLDPHNVARDWGRSLAAEIVSIVESGEVGDSILRFPSRAAFLAQFLSDLAAGRAWGKWYYEEFADLRVLSDRQAICAIYLRRDTPAVELLLQIASIGRLETVLQALSDADARLIFELCFESATAANPFNSQKWIGTVLELWNSAPLRAASHSESRFRDALRLLARTLSRFPKSQLDVNLKTVIEGLLELRRLLLEIRFPALQHSVIKNLAAGDIRSATEIATRAGISNSTEALAFLSNAMGGDADWASQAVAVILGESNQGRFLNSKTISEGESFLSSSGGVFVLGPSLIALQLEEIARTTAEHCESPEETAAILRHLVACKCLGRSRFADASDDPAVRLFSGFDGTCFRKAFADTHISKLDLGAVHKMLLRALLDRDESNRPIFFADCISFPGDNPIVLLRDLLRDEWLDIIPLADAGQDITEVLRSSGQRISVVWKADHPTLFLGDSLCSRIDTAVGQTSNTFFALRRMDDSAQDYLAQILAVTRAELSFRLSSAAHHFPYFSLCGILPNFDKDSQLDCTITLIARAALRHFVRKLFGFESSSPEHIYQNFLSGVSEIRRIEQRLEIRLPASPLSLILRMAGVHDHKYEPSWLKGMQIWLLPPQE